MLSRLQFACLASALAFPTTQLAAQVTITSDEVMRIHFVTQPPFNTQPDALRLLLGILTVNQPFTTRTVDLWDCSTLLGTHSNSLFGNHQGQLSLSPTNTFRTATSVYGTLNPAVVDFTSIRNGSISGIMDFRIATGSITLTSLSQVSLSMIRAVSSGGGSVTSPAPIITSIEVVPDLTLAPATLNATNTLSVTGATPASTMFFTFGTRCGQLPLPCPGAPLLDIANPFAFVGIPVDASGQASLSFFVPNTTAGLSFLMQGIELDGCLRATNLVPVTF